MNDTCWEDHLRHQFYLFALSGSLMVCFRINEILLPRKAKPRLPDMTALRSQQCRSILLTSPDGRDLRLKVQSSYALGPRPCENTKSSVSGVTLPFPGRRQANTRRSEGATFEKVY